MSNNMVRECATTRCNAQQQGAMNNNKVGGGAKTWCENAQRQGARLGNKGVARQHDARMCNDRDEQPKGARRRNYKVLGEQQQGV